MSEYVLGEVFHAEAAGKLGKAMADTRGAILEDVRTTVTAAHAETCTCLMCKKAKSGVATQAVNEAIESVGGEPRRAGVPQSEANLQARADKTRARTSATNGVGQCNSAEMPTPPIPTCKHGSRRDLCKYAECRKP